MGGVQPPCKEGGGALQEEGPEKDRRGLREKIPFRNGKSGHGFSRGKIYENGALWKYVAGVGPGAKPCSGGPGKRKSPLLRQGTRNFS